MKEHLLCKNLRFRLRLPITSAAQKEYDGHLIQVISRKLRVAASFERLLQKMLTL